jgi:hypothetical protein
METSDQRRAPNTPNLPPRPQLREHTLRWSQRCLIGWQHWSRGLPDTEAFTGPLCLLPVMGAKAQSVFQQTPLQCFWPNVPLDSWVQVCRDGRPAGRFWTLSSSPGPAQQHTPEALPLAFLSVYIWRTNRVQDWKPFSVLAARAI